MIYAIKSPGETNEKLLLKYKKLFFQSRIANKLKAERYFTKKPSKRKIREGAIVRELYRTLNKKSYLL